MAQHKSFSSAFKKINQNINKSQAQALNKAVTAGRTLYAKEVSKQLGLPSARVKKRSWITKATTGVLSATLNIGTRTMIAAHDLKPVKKVSVDSRLGTRYGATYKDAQGTQFAGQGFTAKGKGSGKLIILNRYGKGIKELETVFVNVFIKAVDGVRTVVKSRMVESFKTNFTNAIKFNSEK